MIQILEFTFQSFWHFSGVAIIGNGILYYGINGMVRMHSRTMRMLMVRKHGWSPPHLDADGDWMPKENEDEST